MSIYTGDQKVHVETREDFSNENGFVTVKTYRGTEEQLRTQQQADAALGYATRWVQREGVFELETTIMEPDRNPDGSTGDKPPVDDWQIATSYAQAPVWGDDYLRVYIKENNIPEPDIDNLDAADAVISTYKATCEDNKKKYYKTDGTVDETRPGPTPKENFKPLYRNNDPITDATELAFLKDFYDQTVIKGSDKVNVARITLTRRRIMGWKHALRYKATGVNVAWEPDFFYTTFNVPGHITALLPALSSLPDPPKLTKWGWTLTAQSLETSGTAIRVQERLEWVFAPLRVYTFKFEVPPPP